MSTHGAVSFGFRVTKRPFKVRFKVLLLSKASGYVSESTGWLAGTVRQYLRLRRVVV